MFSEATPWRLAPPRPPQAIMAMLSLSLRFRARSTAGAAKAAAAVAATVRPNWRRVVEDGLFGVMEQAPGRLRVGPSEVGRARFACRNRPAPFRITGAGRRCKTLA